jgi:hypothetical protein
MNSWGRWRLAGVVRAGLTPARGQRSQVDPASFVWLIPIGWLFSKRMKFDFPLKRAASLFVILLLALGAARGQSLDSSSPGGFSSSFAKLFGNIKAFSARADVQILDESQKEIAQTPLDFAFLNDKVRVDADLSKMKNKDMSAGAISMLEKMGLSQVVSITRADQKRVFIIYPQSKCYTFMELSDRDSEEAQKKLLVERTVLGKETVNGQACVKKKVIIKDDKGSSSEAFTWEAAALNDFPIKIVTTEKNKTSVIHFSNIKFAKPDASFFAPPAGYKMYKDQGELMMNLMKKGNAGEAPK